MLNFIEKKNLNLLEMGNAISEERKILLTSFAQYISNKLEEEKKINLTFICTHNSRRSTMRQIWTQTAAEYFKLPIIKCYSGGTEATKFNPRADETVSHAGFEVKQTNKSDNPKYTERLELRCFCF